VIGQGKNANLNKRPPGRGGSRAESSSINIAWRTGFVRASVLYRIFDIDLAPSGISRIMKIKDATLHEIKLSTSTHDFLQSLLPGYKLLTMSPCASRQSVMAPTLGSEIGQVSTATSNVKLTDVPLKVV